MELNPTERELNYTQVLGVLTILISKLNYIGAGRFLSDSVELLSSSLV